MSNVNSVVVSGNLTRDPELKWTSEDGESGIVNLGIAVNRSRKKDDEWVDEVSYFDADVFGKFAFLVARKLKKGDAATIQGRLEMQEYEKDGEKRKAIRIVATTIDSEGFFRPKEEDNTVEAATTPVTNETAATPTDDDIPF